MTGASAPNCRHLSPLALAQFVHIRRQKGAPNMNRRIVGTLKRLAKLLGCLLAIELVLPGGTVLVPIPCARGEAGSADSATGSPERPGGARETRGWEQPAGMPTVQ